MTWWQITLLVVGYITTGMFFCIGYNILLKTEIEQHELVINAFFWPFVLLLAIIMNIFDVDNWNMLIARINRWRERRIRADSMAPIRNSDISRELHQSPQAHLELSRLPEKEWREAQAKKAKPTKIPKSEIVRSDLQL